MVTIYFSYNGKEITLPVNPAELEVIRPSQSESADIVSRGEVSIPATPGLSTIVIDSQFWKRKPTDLNPNAYVQWFVDWQKSKIPARIKTIGLENNISMLVTCEEFSTPQKTGEESEVYYTLSLREYRTYGAHTVSAKKKKTPPRDSSKKSTPKTHTVKKGDTINSITKKYTGGTAKWKDLYNANKKILAKFAGKPKAPIPAGTKLSIPGGWK